jgi:hypothetical protein
MFNSLIVIKLDGTLVEKSCSPQDPLYPFGLEKTHGRPA